MVINYNMATKTPQQYLAEERDQQAIALAKAIRQHETGNRPVAGQTGELPSRYQFIPSTWKSEAGRILGDPNAPITLENENRVAYVRIKEWKDKGYTPKQIASMWNSGNPDPYAKGNKGVGASSTNPNVQFNVPKYVESVYANYKKFKPVSQPTSETTQPQETKTVTQPVQIEEKSGLLNLLGTNISNLASGIGTGVLSSARQASDLVNKGLSKLPQSVKTSVLTKPNLLPLAGASTVLSKVSPAMSSLEKNIGTEQGALTKVPKTTAGKVGYYGEKVAEFLQPAGVETTASALKTPLTLAAEKLYQSALKPKNIVKGGKIIEESGDIAKIGLNERVWLTKGGVEKTAQKIDEFENALGNAIEQAKGQGVTIKTAGVKEYLDTAKKFFENSFDPQRGEKAVQEIDDIGKRFIAKYGEEIPIEEAQKIKVSTGQALKKYYNELSGAAQEGEKQGVRFLKEKIVEKAPQVGDINKRLKNLYTFDNALTKASGRIGNLNLLGLGTKLGAAAAGSKGATVGLVMDLIDSPAIKSGAGITLNELGKLGAKGAIPINALLGLIRAKIEENQ